ncbi:MAG: AbrB/MazE/SpoVT family DNA-binding domain-containing protein [Proteobacteria bacterium]|nr:AbrB/MazE/SpoVT family DNA-binding domain-containing protein [Pseudomonadota bacterium]
MNLPAQIRREAGLENGGPVMVSVVDGEIRIRDLRQVLKDLQQQAKAVFADTGESVDRFIEERRAEANRDADPRP